MSSDLTQWLAAGNEAHLNGDDEGAEAAYRRALDEGEEDAAYYLGDLLVQLNRAEEAEPLLRGVIAAGDTDGHIPLGNALWDLERHEEAETEYRAAAAVGQTAAH